MNPTLTDGSEVQQLLEEIPEPHLLPRVVGATVGKVPHDGQHLIEPAGKA